MTFKERFILLRGNKVNNKVIKKHSPELLKNKELTVEKLNWTYFLLDMQELKVVGKFNNLLFTNDKKTFDLDLLLPFLTEEKSIETSSKLFDFYDKDNIKYYTFNGMWFFAVLYGTGSILVNGKAFTDFTYYFSRQGKIERIINE